MKMKDLCAEERPREKMLRKGVKALSNAELLAVLLGSGVGGKNAVEVAQEMLVSAGGRLGRLGLMPLEQLSAQKGVGAVRSLVIAAALELGRRSYEESTTESRRPLTDPDMVFRLMLPLLKKLDHEECWVLLLSRGGFLIGKELLTTGTVQSSLIDARQVLKKVVEKQAAMVILVHNHPEGSPMPGEQDIRETARLKKALSVLEVPLLDHVIIAEDSYYSFSEERLVRPE